jgi:hypothetical protein
LNQQLRNGENALLIPDDHAFGSADACACLADKATAARAGLLCSEIDRIDVKPALVSFIDAPSPAEISRLKYHRICSPAVGSGSFCNR